MVTFLLFQLMLEPLNLIMIIAKIRAPYRNQNLPVCQYILVTNYSDFALFYQRI